MRSRNVGLVALLTVLIAHTGVCSFGGQTMDLRSIERAISPNDALACPSGLCRAKGDFESPVFSIDKKDLLDRTQAIIAAEPRTELVGKELGLEQLIYVQHSALFAFPDTVWIQAVDVDEGTSIIVYSRSNYGYWDLGVNRDRLRRWLEKLESAIKGDRVPALKPTR